LKLYPDFEAILDLQRDMVCRFLPDTTLTYVNQSYCRVFKKTKFELIGKKFLDFIPEEEHANILNHLENLSVKGGPISYTHKIIRDSGEIQWQEWTDYIVARKDGVPVEFQSVGTDVTFRELTRLYVHNMEKSAEALLKLNLPPEGISYTKAILNDIRSIKDILPPP